MDIIYEKLLERNARETIPFLSIYESYTSLLNLTDNLQSKCFAAERELENLRQQLHDGESSPLTGSVKGTSSSALNSSTAIQSAMKNETRLREKLESLQEQYDEKWKSEISTTNLLQEAQALNSKNEKNIAELTEEIDVEKNTVVRLMQQVKDAEANSNLMDDQNYKLKVAFRALQDENDKLKKENSMYEERLMREKGKVVEEMNELTDIIERLKVEIGKLRSEQKSKHQDSTSLSWFGSISGGLPKNNIENQDTDTESLTKNQDDVKIGANIVPSTIQRTIVAHTIDGTCVRYDHSGSSNIVATASSDSTVKIWDTGTGQQRGMFRGTPGYAMTCCDLGGTLVVAGGNDRSCRVWDRRNERMIHQLVGHQNKITCVRLFGDDKPSVITGSADHTLKLWDISRKTYRQNITLKHNSTATCVDVSSDCTTAVTGHMDGGIRFWDLRSGQLTAEMSVMHEGGISSIQFKPNDNGHVLSSSVDSSLKVIDLRVRKSIHTFSHSDHATGQLWSGSTFSPDGRYIASGSGSDGTVLVWDTIENSVNTKLSGGHAVGIVSIDWYRSDKGELQLASLDRKGSLVLWQ